MAMKQKANKKKPNKKDKSKITQLFQRIVNGGSVVVEDEQQPKRRLRERPKTQEEIKRENVRDFTSDFLPFTDVRDGLIHMKDGRYVKVIEVEPINFFLLNSDEKDAIIMQFARVFRSSNLISGQMKCLVKRTDSRRYIEILQKHKKQINDVEMEIMLDNYINLIQDLGEKEALTRRYFFIFDFHPDKVRSIGGTVTYQSVLWEMNNMANQIENALKGCGNNVVRYDDIDMSEDVAIAEMLYEYYNPRSSINETFYHRYKRVTEDYMKSNNLYIGYDEEPDLPINEVIAPRGMDFSHSDYFIVDGMYHKIMYIEPSNGYPDSVYAGWANMITNLTEGCHVDIHFEKKNRRSTQRQVSQKLLHRQIDMRKKNQTDSDYEQALLEYQGTAHLKQAITNQDIFDISIFVTVTGTTKENVDRRFRVIKETFEQSELIFQEPVFDMQKAYQSVMPINALHKDLKSRTQRNVATDSLAGMSYFYTAYEVSDQKGIVLGTNKTNKSLCVLDPFNSRNYKNANMVILGTSGSGKTFSSQLMLGRMRLSDIQSFVIAPLKGHEFKRYSDSLNGSYIKLSASSNNTVNIMEIRPVDRTTSRLIDNIAEEDEESLLNQKTQQLNIFFKLLMTNISKREQALLDTAIIETYRRKGITKDNDSLFVDKENSDEFKEMPIIEDLYYLLKDDEMFKDDERSRPLTEVLQQFVTGSYSSFNGQTNVDLDNKYVVLDVSSLSDDLLPLGMFVALDYCWDKIKEDRTQKKSLFIDEVWRLLNTDDIAANFVLEIFKIIRGFGGSAIAATQDLSDFFSKGNEKFGKGIIANSKIKFLLQMEEEELRLVSSSFNLSAEERRNIQNFEQGEALLVANNNKVPIKFEASQLESEMITTDPRELKKLSDSSNTAIGMFRREIEARESEIRSGKRKLLD